jgi:hypothetical protein
MRRRLGGTYDNCETRDQAIDRIFGDSLLPFGR